MTKDVIGVNVLLIPIEVLEGLDKDIYVESLENQIREQSEVLAYQEIRENYAEVFIESLQYLTSLNDNGYLKDDKFINGVKDEVERFRIFYNQLNMKND